MVAAQDAPFPLTPEDYFAWETQQQENYEYIDGRVYAMGGGTVNHSRLAVRLTSRLEAHLASTNCIVGNSDLRVNIAATSNYLYPDASVTCDDRDQATSQYITYPCLIVEVLSDGTEAYDRGAKFRHYRQNPALQDYLLVSSTRIEMDLYRQDEAGQWLIINYQPGDMITLHSINLQFAIESVYRGLTL